MFQIIWINELCTLMICFHSNLVILAVNSQNTVTERKGSTWFPMFGRMLWTIIVPSAPFWDLFSSEGEVLWEGYSSYNSDGQHLGLHSCQGGLEAFRLEKWKQLNVLCFVGLESLLSRHCYRNPKKHMTLWDSASTCIPKNVHGKEIWMYQMRFYAVTWVPLCRGGLGQL